MGDAGCSDLISPAYAKQDHPGVALIIVNQEFEESTGWLDREGAAADLESLKTTFENLGFEVMPMRDATDIKILSELKKGKWQVMKLDYWCIF